MTQKKKQILSAAAGCFVAALIPLLLITYGFQAKRYAELSQEITELEKKQMDLIEQNKKLVSDISLLLSADRIERAADELGMHKAETEDIVRVEMNGAGK